MMSILKKIILGIDILIMMVLIIGCSNVVEKKPNELFEKEYQDCYKVTKLEYCEPDDGNPYYQLYYTWQCKYRYVLKEGINNILFIDYTINNIAINENGYSEYNYDSDDFTSKRLEVKVGMDIESELKSYIEKEIQVFNYSIGKVKKMELYDNDSALSSLYNVTGSYKIDKKFNNDLAPSFAKDSVEEISFDVIKNLIANQVKNTKKMRLINQLQNNKLVTDCEAGEYYDNLVKFGRYQNEDMQWLILDRFDGRALLLNHNVIDAKPYNEVDNKNQWDKSDIRQWLNNEYYNNSFNSYEKNMICVTNLYNKYQYKPMEGNVKRVVIGCENTKDKIFIPDFAELKYFFNDIDVEKQGNITYYGLKKLDECLIGSTAFHNNLSGNGSSIWLRGPGAEDGNHENYALNYGLFDGGCGDVSIISKKIIKYGVLPMMWVAYDDSAVGSEVLLNNYGKDELSASAKKFIEKNEKDKIAKEQKEKENEKIRKDNEKNKRKVNPNAKYVEHDMISFFSAVSNKKSEKLAYIDFMDEILSVNLDDKKYETTIEFGNGETPHAVIFTSKDKDIYDMVKDMKIRKGHSIRIKGTYNEKFAMMYFYLIDNIEFYQ